MDRIDAFLWEIGQDSKFIVPTNFCYYELFLNYIAFWNSVCYAVIHNSITREAYLVNISRGGGNNFLCLCFGIWIIKFNLTAYSNIPLRKYEIYNVDGWCYMANIKDCLGFETFGADVKEARKVKQLSRKTLAEQINIDWRYLANLENDDTIPSLPVIIQLNLEWNVYWYNGKVNGAVYTLRKKHRIQSR